MRVSEKKCTFAGHEISFFEAGSGHRTLLFLHGFPMNKSLWRAQLETLSPDYHCIAPDLTGFGGSPSPADYVASIDRFADEMALILKSKASGPVVVVGLSMGGMIALALAERHPALVRGLALLHTSAEADNDDARAARNQAMEDILTKGRESFARAFTDMVIGMNATPIARAKSLSMMENANYESLIAGMTALRDRSDRSNFLPRINIPVMVMAGADDTRTPPAAMQQIANAIPAGEFMTLPGVGHMSPIENAALLNEALGTWLLKAFDLKKAPQQSAAMPQHLH